MTSATCEFAVKRPNMLPIISFQKNLLQIRFFLLFKKKSKKTKWRYVIKHTHIHTLLFG